MPVRALSRALLCAAAFGAATLAFAAPASAADAGLLAGDVLDLTASPGDTVTVTPQLHNPGGEATGVRLRVWADAGFDLAETSANCRYRDSAVYERTWAICDFASPAAAGRAFRASAPFSAKVRDVAFGSVFEYAWYLPGEDGYAQPGDAEPGWRAGSGTALTLVDTGAAGTGSGSNGTHAFLAITGGSGYDLAAVGGTATGKSGDTVKAVIGLDNRGATVDASRSGETIAALRFTVPAGTTATGVPEGCRETGTGETGPGKARYDCASGIFVPGGAHLTWTFSLRLDKDLTGAKGALLVADPHTSEDRPVSDDDTANNRADVVINPTVTPTPSAPKPGAAKPDAGKPLAKTGFGVPVGLAGGLLLAGGALLALSRRRTPGHQA